MMKKLTALLLCLTLLCSVTLASAAAPAGWKSHRVPGTSRTVWLPADFTTSISSFQNIPREELDGSLATVSHSRNSLLLVTPVGEDYDPPNAFIRMALQLLIDLYKPWALALLGTDEMELTDLAIVNVSAKRPYLVMETVDGTGELHFLIYLPLYDDPHFTLVYMSYGDRVTDEERDMIFSVALHME